MPETINYQCDTGGDIVCYHRISPKGCICGWDGKGDCPCRLPVKIPRTQTIENDVKGRLNNGY
jgi:hypothetical protein